MPTLNKNKAIMHDAAGRRLRRVVEYTGPASYTALGDPFAPKDVDLGTFDCAPSAVALDRVGVATRLLVYDYTTAVYRWFIPSTGAEVAGAQDLSAFTVRLEIIGY